MSEGAPQAKPRDRAFTGFFALVATAVACAVVLVATPRAVVPARLPPLVLEREAVKAQLERDRALAARAPRDAEIELLETLYLDEGRAERAGQAGVKGIEARGARLSLLAQGVFARIGQDGVVALRARATERFVRALHGELEDTREAEGLVGKFPDVLAQYGLRRADGELLAPEASVRAMYKARWNVVHARAPLYALDRLDILAYQGWNALHATTLAPGSRAAAAQAYRDANGYRGDEALAVWLYQGQRVAESLQLFEQAYADRPELSLRNRALFVRRETLP